MNNATNEQSTATVRAPLTPEQGEYLSFRLGGEEYGIDILAVQEIRGYDQITAIANAPAFIKGVTNLRGIIVPIVDLRIRFNVGVPTYDALTVVIILNLATRVVGVVVDSVSDVLTLLRDQIKSAPEFSDVVAAQHIVGLGTIDDRMLILLDIATLMADEGMGLVASTRH